MIRIKHTREMYIPAKSQRVSHKASSAVAYLYENAKGQPCALGFAGRARKPMWRYRFRTTAAREKTIGQFFASVQAREESQARHRAQGRGLAVGDILSAVWGYDQTNVDWFEVTALVGKTMVEVRPIAAEREETHWLQGKTVPLPGHYTGDPVRRRAIGGRVKIDDVRSASKCDELARVGGRPVIAAAHYTAYA